MQQVTKISAHGSVGGEYVVTAPEEEVIDLGALVGTLWRGKWIVALVTAACVFLGGYYAFVAAVPRYEANSVVILETQQQTVVDIESVMGGLSADTSTINSEIEVLRSRSLMGKVVEKLDLEADPEFNSELKESSALDRLKARLRAAIAGADDGAPPMTEAQIAAQRRDRTISALLGVVSVRNVPNSLVFQIAVTSEQPAKSALIADTIADLYILNQLEVKYDATQQATSWLTDQVGELRVELEDAEARLAEFSTGTDLVSALALQALERQLKDIRDRIGLSGEQSAAQSARITALESARTREEQAEITGDAQLGRLLPRIENEPASGTAFDTRFEQLMDRARLDLQRTEQQLGALRQSEAELSRRIETQGEDLIQLQQLQREAEANRALYEYFLGRLKETSAQQGIQRADSRVLSDAVVPLGPSEPRRSLILAVSGLLGLMLGAGLVLLAEARNRSFRTAGELEAATGLTVLGQIPRIPARGRRRSLQYLSEKPSSGAAEAIRNLRTSVLLSNVDNPPRVILSTSAIPGEGKTTNSLALAQNLVGMGKKVMLVEGDIRRRTLSQYFDGIPDKGLVSVLSGEMPLEEAIFRPEGFGADILVGEKTGVNAADLFSSDKFRSLIADLRGYYDAVVIDTPPVLVVPDARIIAQEVDAVLFTVRWDSTSKAQVAEGLRLFRQSGQRVTGLVLSQINARGMKRYGYGGKYGAYAGYGAKYYVN